VGTGRSAGFAAPSEQRADWAVVGNLDDALLDEHVGVGVVSGGHDDLTGAEADVCRAIGEAVERVHRQRSETCQPAQDRDLVIARDATMNDVR
jgi:hypothetical protein